VRSYPYRLLAVFAFCLAHGLASADDGGVTVTFTIQIRECVEPRDIESQCASLLQESADTQAAPAANGPTVTETVNRAIPTDLRPGELISMSECSKILNTRWDLSVQETASESIAVNLKYEYTPAGGQTRSGKTQLAVQPDGKPRRFSTGSSMKISGDQRTTTQESLYIAVARPDSNGN
jgi:hypothetical protein